VIGSLAKKAKFIASFVFGMLPFAPKSDVFDYEFSGISVWLEPDERDAAVVSKTMGHLADVCGGPIKGLHPFASHCTMLYNMPLSQFLEKDGECIDDWKKNAQTMLEKSVEDYKTKVGDDFVLTLVPMTLNVFRYPPFRCIITYLHLETTLGLTTLHQSLMKVFPRDERHENGGTSSFMPHMSLVYAPESCDPLLFEETTQLRTGENGPLLLKPMRAKYLSVWSTKGTTSDWERIAKVELP